MNEKKQNVWFSFFKRRGDSKKCHADSYFITWCMETYKCLGIKAVFSIRISIEAKESKIDHVVHMKFEGWGICSLKDI